jgi:hypothetical protein
VVVVTSRRVLKLVEPAIEYLNIIRALRYQPLDGELVTAERDEVLRYLKKADMVLARLKHELEKPE